MADAITGTGTAGVFSFTIPGSAILNNTDAIVIGPVAGLTAPTRHAVTTVAAPTGASWQAVPANVVENASFSFTVRVAGNTHTGIPAVQYSVGGAAGVALTPTNTPALSGTGTGNQDFTFTVPVDVATGAIELSITGGLTARAQFSVSATGFTNNAGGTATWRLWSATGNAGSAITMPQATGATEGLDYQVATRITNRTHTTLWLSYTNNGVPGVVQSTRNADQGTGGTTNREFFFTIPNAQGNIVLIANHITHPNAVTVTNAGFDNVTDSPFTSANALSWRTWAASGNSAAALTFPASAIPGQSFQFAMRVGNGRTPASIWVSFTDNGVFRSVQSQRTADPGGTGTNRDFFFTIPDVAGPIVLLASHSAQPTPPLQMFDITVSTNLDGTDQPAPTVWQNRSYITRAYIAAYIGGREFVSISFNGDTAITDINEIPETTPVTAAMTIALVLTSPSAGYTVTVVVEDDGENPAAWAVADAAVGITQADIDALVAAVNLANDDFEVSAITVTVYSETPVNLTGPDFVLADTVIINNNVTITVTLTAVAP
jgi:hypothetical protein